MLFLEKPLKRRREQVYEGLVKKPSAKRLNFAKIKRIGGKTTCYHRGGGVPYPAVELRRVATRVACVKTYFIFYEVMYVYMHAYVYIRLFALCVNI